MPHDIATILADTTPYGFVFDLETVKRDGRSFPNVPILHVVDTVKFEAAFPGVILAAVNGQSVKVASQRIGRDASYENHSKPDDIKRKNVEWLLGIKTATTRVMFAGPEVDGKTELYETQEEASAAWLEWASQQ